MWENSIEMVSRQGGNQYEKDHVRFSGGDGDASRKPPVGSRRGKACADRRIHWNRESWMGRTSSQVAPPRIRTPLLLADNSRAGTMVSLRLLCAWACGGSAGTPGICPAGAGGAPVLVLLPGGTGILSLCEELSGRVDEGGTRSGTPPTVVEGI